MQVHGASFPELWKPSPGRSVTHKRGLFVIRISKLRVSDPRHGSSTRTCEAGNQTGTSDLAGNPAPQRQELTRLVCFLCRRPSVVSYKSPASYVLNIVCAVSAKSLTRTPAIFHWRQKKTLDLTVNSHPEP